MLWDCVPKTGLVGSESRSSRISRYPDTGIPNEETVDFRLDLNTPVNWREGQTERSGFLRADAECASKDSNLNTNDLARLAGSALSGMNTMQIGSPLWTRFELSSHKTGRGGTNETPCV